MTKTAAITAIATILTAGCGADCEIPGQYVVRSVRDGLAPGSCGPLEGENQAATLTFRDDSGGLSVLLPGTSGACPVTRNGCEVAGDCTYSDPATGALLATYTFDYLVDGDEISGPSSLAFTPAAGVEDEPAGCTANYQDLGTRR